MAILLVVINIMGIIIIKLYYVSGNLLNCLYQTYLICS